MTEQKVFRTTYQAVFSATVGLVALCAGIGIASKVVVDGVSESESGNAAGFAVFVLLFTLPLAAACFRLARAGVEVGVDGANLRMILRDRFVPWSDLAGFRYEVSKDFGAGPMCVAETFDGTKISVIGLCGPNINMRKGPSKAELDIARLNEIVLAYGEAQKAGLGTDTTPPVFQR